MTSKISYFPVKKKKRKKRRTWNQFFCLFDRLKLTKFLFECSLVKYLLNIFLGVHSKRVSFDLLTFYFWVPFSVCTICLRLANLKTTESWTLNLAKARKQPEFFTRNECSFTSSSLETSVVLRVLHSKRV
jgi:hypothetical protein